MNKIQKILLYAATFVAAILSLSSCYENVIDETKTYDGDVEAYVNLNPDEPIILTVSNEKGESIVVQGVKGEAGHPESVSMMTITLSDEEVPSEFFFNSERQLQEIISPNGVRFQFEWISDTQAALTVIDPNTNEQLNTLLDLEAPIEDTQLQETKTVSALSRKGNLELVLEPIRNEELHSSGVITRSSGGVTGNVYLEQCGQPASAQCWVDVYDYSNQTGSYGLGKYRGRFYCTQVEKGHYQFTLPTSFHEHHDLADYCDAINSVVDFVCSVNAYTAPGSGAKQYLCVAVSAVIASGMVSAPVAAGFLKACLTVSTALDAGCSLLSGNLDLPEGTPTIADGLCGILHEMDAEWDVPLVLRPVVNAMPSYIYGARKYYDANEPIEDLKVKWGTKPVINSFKLNPAAPSEGVSYVAIAQLYCLPPGAQVIMDIVGTDGYTDSSSTEIGTDSDLNYTASLYVPGAERGVRDVCTVTVITPDGETITKKASLVFQ